MDQSEYGLMSTEKLTDLLRWDSMQVGNQGLLTADVLLICKIIAARKNARSEDAVAYRRFLCEE